MIGDRGTLAALVSAFLFPMLLVAQPAPDPFTGTWKLNAQRSALPAPVPQSWVIQLDINGETIRAREDTVGKDGRVSTVKVEARFDGRDYPVPGATDIDRIAYSRINDYTIQAVGKKNGKLVEREMITVSRDGKTLRTSYSLVSATGQRMSATAVFDKQ